MSKLLMMFRIIVQYSYQVLYYNFATQQQQQSDNTQTGYFSIVNLDIFQQGRDHLMAGQWQRRFFIDTFK